MSMCYLCDVCANYRGNVMGENIEYRRWIACHATPEVFQKLKAIDYGRQDPWKICKHFDPKEGGDD